MIIPNYNNQEHNIREIDNWNLKTKTDIRNYTKTEIPFNNILYNTDNTIFLCLKTLLLNNKEVQFKYWNYDDKLLTIITDKKVNIDKWNEFINKTRINDMNELTEQLNIRSQNDNSNQISLYSVYQFIKNMYKKQNDIAKQYINNYNSIINDKMKVKMNVNNIYLRSDDHIIINIYYNHTYEIDLYKDEFGWYHFSSYFNAENDDIENIIKQFLGRISPYLDKYQQDTIIYTKLEKEIQNWPVESVNSKLLATINFNTGITVYTNTDKEINLFNIFYQPTKEVFEYQTNYMLILNLLINHGYDILNNMYIDINQMPEWMVPYLKQIREDELAKPKYIETDPQEVMQKPEKLKRKSFFKRLFH